MKLEFLLTPTSDLRRRSPSIATASASPRCGAKATRRSRWPCRAPRCSSCSTPTPPTPRAGRCSSWTASRRSMPHARRRSPCSTGPRRSPAASWPPTRTRAERPSTSWTSRRTRSLVERAVLSWSKESRTICGRLWSAASVDPALDRDPEDADPRLGDQARGGLVDAAAAERLGERRGEDASLTQLALVELGVGGDEGLAPAGVLAALLEHLAGGLDRRGDGVDRRDAVARLGDRRHEQLLERGRAGEQHLALVGVVPRDARRPSRGSARPARRSPATVVFSNAALAVPRIAKSGHRGRLCETIAQRGRARSGSASPWSSPRANADRLRGALVGAPDKTLGDVGARWRDPLDTTPSTPRADCPPGAASPRPRGRRPRSTRTDRAEDERSPRRRAIAASVGQHLAPSRRWSPWSAALAAWRTAYSAADVRRRPVALTARARRDGSLTHRGRPTRSAGATLSEWIRAR